MWLLVISVEIDLIRFDSHEEAFCYYFSIQTDRDKYAACSFALSFGPLTSSFPFFPTVYFLRVFPIFIITLLHY